jgi:hypothetical protein
MKSHGIVAIALFSVLAGGCATQTSESTHADVMAAHCTDSTYGTAGCDKRLNANPSVARNRCIETILFRDTRQGALHRAVLC